MDRKPGTHSIRHHSDVVVCRACGKSGTIAWEEVSRLNKSTVPELVGIDGPFFERLGRKPPYPIELVCRACGGVAATAFPSTFLHDKGDFH